MSRRLALLVPFRTHTRLLFGDLLAQRLSAGSALNAFATAVRIFCTSA